MENINLFYYYNYNYNNYFKDYINYFKDYNYFYNKHMEKILLKNNTYNSYNNHLLNYNTEIDFNYDFDNNYDYDNNLYIYNTTLINFSNNYFVGIYIIYYNIDYDNSCYKRKIFNKEDVLQDTNITYNRFMKKNYDLKKFSNKYHGIRIFDKFMNLDYDKRYKITLKRRLIKKKIHDVPIYTTFQYDYSDYLDNIIIYFMNEVLVSYSIQSLPEIINIKPI